MNISIIGTGNVGSSLAQGWLKSGHKVAFGVRDPHTFGGGKLPGLSTVQAKTVEEATEGADVIVISAVPQAVHEIASSLGDVSSKIIIDTMNSVRVKPDPYNNTTEALVALTNCKDIVKCFNTTGAENMANPNYGIMRIDMFYAGDSAKAKETAAQLAKDLGFENVYDFGGSDKFQLMEHFAMSWINLAIMQGYGRDFAFKIVKRQTSESN
ncbi:MAG: NAD(P)-binding domain-containing protein [Cyclobacteriaceae bacterium]|nr:NAD(P)-binding domain-containing protein [Cyclobacteriaceae bacterium]